MEKIFFKLGDNIPSLGDKSALMLGTFDGFHKGHLSLLEETLNFKESAILLFEKNYSELFSTTKEKRVLMSLEDKLNFLNHYSLSRVYILQNEASFFSLSKEDFIKKILLKIAPKNVVIGEDYTFGKDGEGKEKDLKEYFNVFSLPLLKDEEKKIGTERIKASLKEGDIQKANSLLLRPYEIHGKIVKGFQNGRKISFPTANLDLSIDYLLPKRGVYGGISYLRGMPYKCIINVGEAPTVGKLKKEIVEVYLDGFIGNCYEETLYVDFLFFIREEKQFASLEKLKNQLQKDLETMRKELTNL